MTNNQNNTLSICEVTRDNWQAALCLAVHSDQQRFISEVIPIAAIALAKAYIRPRGLLWLPYALYAGTEMIGCTDLHACVANFVADEDVVGVLPGTNADQPQRCGRLAHEDRNSFS
jgi:hypothetical protein